MNDQQIQELIASSPLAWITFNKFINENQQPIEFDNHRFLIDFYADESDDIVSKKSAQVGFSVAAILKSFHAAKYRGRNIIYGLPTNNVVQDFVKPKVNPLIGSNPALAAIISDDSVSYKRVGDRNLFFKGGYSDREAISITGDILVIDEYDRMPNMAVVNTFDSRLQASKNPKRWRFSNPSQIGFGVDALFQDSNQLHWFVKCSHCNHEWYMEWEPEGKCHYVNKELGIYACGNCGKELNDHDRRMGRWVARYPDRKRHGYWFSQMMAPWVSAKRIIEQYEESSTGFFYNFVLGKAYTPSDLVVNRETILRACAPSIIPRVNVALGVDQDAGGQYWVAMTAQGVFDYGKTKSWEELERIKLTYNATVVCDPAPYPTIPKQLASKYNDFYLCYFKESSNLSLLQWKETSVYVDRTRLLDIVANEITEAKLLFRQRPQELETYIADWNNIYRTTEEKPDGRTKSVWMKKENKNSDLSFATAYARVALTQLMNGSNSSFIEPSFLPEIKVTATMNENGRTYTSLGENIKDTFENLND